MYKRQTYKSQLTHILYVIQGLPGKIPAIVNIMRTVCVTSCNLAAKESGLECTCVNNDDFTVLVSGGGRRCGVSVYCVAVAFKMSRAMNLHQILH